MGHLGHAQGKSQGSWLGGQLCFGPRPTKEIEKMLLIFKSSIDFKFI
jgi:hypothetical protein